MRTALFFFVVSMVAACTRTSGPPAEQVELPDGGPPPIKASAVTPPPSPTPSAPSGKRCLPVVAAECGCVYECGVGIESPPGSWSVTHGFWKGTTLKAKVKSWCVKGDCTEAFHAELPCDIICPPKPADHGCHFDGDRCVGSTP
jgi:hypothetical protein